MEREKFTMHDVRSRTYKGRDAWWTVILVDPLAGRLSLLAANRTSLTPNQLSVTALVLGLGAAGCFLAGDWKWLVAGAALYHLGFVLDCMDGKIARLKGNSTVFGGWLDYVFDRIRVFICASSLALGQYLATGRPVYLCLGTLIVFLDMLRYLDALKVAAVRREMRRRIRHAYRALHAEDPERRDASMALIERSFPEHPDENALLEPPGHPAQDEHPDGTVRPGENAAPSAKDVDLHHGFRNRFSWYQDARQWLAERRIRTHIVSGVEFQMAAFIVGPLFNAIIPVTAGAGLLLLVFELAIVYKLWLSSRDFTRALGEIPVPAPAGTG